MLISVVVIVYLQFELSIGVDTMLTVSAWSEISLSVELIMDFLVLFDA